MRQLAVRDGVGEEVKTALLEAMYRLDQQAKGKEAEAIAVSEAESEPDSETPDTETVETNADHGFAFAFEPASETDQRSNYEVEAQQDLNDLEM